MSCTSLATLVFFAGYIIGLTLPLPMNFNQASASEERHEKSSGSSISYISSAIAETYLNQPIQQVRDENFPPKEKIILTQRDFRPTTRSPEFQNPFLQIVEEKPYPVFKTSDDRPLRKLSFTVLAGSFPSKAEAEKYHSQLRQKGYHPQPIYLALSKGQKWYNILIGNYKNLEDASQAVSEFNRKETMITAVVASVSKKLPLTILADAFLEEKKGEEKAGKLLAHLKKTEYIRYKPVIYPAQDFRKQKWFAILLNYDEKDSQKAYQLVSRLKDDEKRTRAEVTYKEDEPGWNVIKKGVSLRSLREILNHFPSSEDESPHPYTIQLASYRSRKSAQEGRLRFERHGVSPYLGRRGKWWISYMGRYKSREAAETARKQYEKRIKKASRRSDSLVRKMPYSNFIGSFSSDDNKTPKFQRLERLGYSPYFMKGAEDEDFKLFVGVYKTKKEAEKQIRRLKANGVSGQVAER
ncbi:SPOR domain-containing protein [Desulfonema magnum]|nr:SPOR domain-containing protein [Desulfonema magnum]